MTKKESLLIFILATVQFLHIMDFMIIMPLGDIFIKEFSIDAAQFSFMVAAYSNRDSSHIHKIDKLVHDYYIGGLIFFQGDPVAQANLTNRYQEKSKIPLFIAMDA